MVLARFSGYTEEAGEEGGIEAFPVVCTKKVRQLRSHFFVGDVF